MKPLHCMLVLCLPLGAIATIHADVRPKAPQLTELERKIVELTNLERYKESLPPLQVDAQMMAAARSHSQTMARLGKMAHVLEGKTPDDRLTAAGYDWKDMAENVAASKGNASEIVAQWMKSPGHRMNIMNADYKDIGVGAVASADGKIYSTQVFGSR